jgi:hypothetical protein
MHVKPNRRNMISLFKDELFFEIFKSFAKHMIAWKRQNRVFTSYIEYMLALAKVIAQAYH